MMSQGPILGNGGLGVIVSSTKPNNVVFYLGHNAMWALEKYPNSERPLPPNFHDMPYPVRASVGLVSFDVASSYFQSSSTDFFAQEFIANSSVVVSLTSTTNSSLWVQFVAFVDQSQDLFYVQAFVPSFIDNLPLNVTVNTSSSAGPTSAGCSAPLGEGSTACAAGTQPWGNFITRYAFDPWGPMPVEAAIVVRQLGGNIAAGAISDGMLSSTSLTSLTASEYIYFVIGCTTNVGLFQDPLSFLQKLTASFSPELVIQAQSSHNSYWNNFYNVSWISLPQDPLTEGYWFGSQHNLAAAAGDSAALVAPGLWGPWVTQDNPAWHGDYTLDYNYEAQYYGAFSSNHAELASSYYQPILDYMPQALIDGLFYSPNCTGGLHYPSHLAPFGFPSTLGPAPYGDYYLHSNGLFASLPFIWNWEYTRNVSFLRDTSWPLLSGLARWWVCWLDKVFIDPQTLSHDLHQKRSFKFTRNAMNESDYVYVDPSDCDNEGCTYDTPTGRPNNSIISLSFVKHLFKVLPDMAAALEEDVDPIWTDIYENLVPWPTAVTPLKQTTWSKCNEAGLMAQGQNPLNVYPLFPGGVVSLNSSAEDLSTGVNTILWDDSWIQGNSFCVIFTAAARAGIDSVDLVDTWRALLKTSIFQNFMVDIAGGGLESVGAAQFVNDLLLQSHEGYLNFFPLWRTLDPLEDASFYHLRGVGAFLVSASFSSSGIVSEISILSEAGEPCSVLYPFATTPVPPLSVLVQDSHGNKISVSWGVGSKGALFFTFETVPGMTYTIQDA